MDTASTDQPVDHGGGPRVAAAAAEAAAADRASRRWRTIWRTHFYAGLFAAPVLVMLAVTGLVILYTQPIQDLTQRDLRVVSATGSAKSLDAQEAAVAEAYPNAAVTSVVVPRNATTATEFGLDDGRSVFVNPYTSAVLGRADPGGGIVGLANRLHGTFNNETVTVKLPAVAGLLGSGPIMQEFVVGDMLLEVFAGWAILLVASGLYLWWPRRSRARAGRAGKALLVPRLGKRGRARWRDLHAIPGMALAAATLFVLVTGLFWSSYWGTNFTAAANKITPNHSIDPPSSSIAKLGDLDRLRNKINWNTADTPIPNSTTEGLDPASLPAPVSLDVVVAAARDEGMKPGYSISYPENGTDDAGNPTFGSFTLANSWPRKTSEAKTVYLDQFTGRTISTMDVYGNGGVSVVSDTLVSTHMGTQFGVVNRAVLTLVCLAVIWSVVSAVVMYVKRRRTGSLGLPRRPADVRLGPGLLAIVVVFALVYPLWGITALIVLAIDALVVRRTPRLRATFGQR
jgi:uncharacterized iron-regulated membrane protein